MQLASHAQAIESIGTKEVAEMKFEGVAALCGLVVLAAMARAAEPSARIEKIGAVQVRDLNLKEIDSTHARIAVDLALVPERSVTLKNIQLCSLRLNGLPVFASSLNEEVVLTKDAQITLPPLYVTVLFRDITALDPLRRMVEKQSVHLEGEMLSEVKLNALEKLALGTLHPKVALTLNQDVPLAIGGDLLGRSLALKVLEVADASLGAKAKISGLIPDMRPEWIRQLEKQAAASLFIVETQYTLADAGQKNVIKSDNLGFYIGPERVVTTREALEPWKYDPEYRNLVKTEMATLDKKDVHTEMWQAGGNPVGSRFGIPDFSVAIRGKQTKDSITSPEGKYDLLRRGAPDALAVLTLHKAANEGGLASAMPGTIAQDHWDQVAVFRLHMDGKTGQAAVEILPIRAFRDGHAIRLSDPVDSAVFGSPIVTPDGVIGIVQDERVGAFLPADILARRAN